MKESFTDDGPEIAMGSLVQIVPGWLPPAYGDKPRPNAQDTYIVIAIDTEKGRGNTYWICPTDLPMQDRQKFLNLGAQKRLNPNLRGPEDVKPESIWGFSKKMLEFRYRH